MSWQSGQSLLGSNLGMMLIKSIEEEGSKKPGSTCQESRKNIEATVKLTTSIIFVLNSVD